MEGRLLGSFTDAVSKRKGSADFQLKGPKNVVMPSMPLIRRQSIGKPANSGMIAIAQMKRRLSGVFEVDEVTERSSIFDDESSKQPTAIAIDINVDQII